MGFFDPEAVETQTGRPIRSAWRRPGVLPCVGEALAAHPAHRASPERLRGMGVRFADPYAPDGQEGEGRPEFGWERGLELLATR
ncbi:hypothetical protein QFZ49_006415 [Streptomyces turgidiscabies]|uniref:Uncharacterized protein n=1 Tax=Streptomyces turgidiscabies TaxID=85558 RepID=A0ABU0RWV0_9ACTN|nr:hypothetical protein [Streptomyces turgidiscabies]